MTSYMPASILNSELGHARERQELHTHAESGPFAFTTATYGKTAAGGTMKSSKDKKAAKKAKRATAKKANAAAGQAAPVAPGAQIDEETKKEAAVIIMQHTMRAKQAQGKQTHASTQHTHAPAPVTSTTAATQSKTKGRRQRVKKMDDADKIKLQNLETEHMLKLRELIQTYETYAEYAKALHDEFVSYATEKEQFYQKLPQSPKKQLFVERAQRNLKKANDYQARTPSLPPQEFKLYRQIKLDCITTLEDIETRHLTPKARKEARQQAFEQRRTAIERLLKQYHDEEEQQEKDVKRAELRQKYGFDK